MKTKAGQGHRAETEAYWGQKSNSGGDKRREKFPVRGGGSGSHGGRGGRGGGDRGARTDRDGAFKGGSSSGGDVTCYCCGKKGHIKPDCPKRSEECRQCGKVGHLVSMCKMKSDGGSATLQRAGEAGLSEEYDGFSFTVTIGSGEAMLGDVAAASGTVFSDIWLGDSGASHHINFFP